MRQVQVVHETLHAYRLFNGLANYDKYTEAATSACGLRYLKTLGSPKGAASYRPNVISYPAEYSWENLPGVISFEARQKVSEMFQYNAC